MPSSWTTRLLSSGTSSSSAAPNQQAHAHQAHASRNKPLPRPPNQNNHYHDAFLDPPTLGPDRLGGSAQSPSKPRSQGTRQHAHNRSSSNPLPKFFGRKKSTGALNGFNDTDVPLDDELVPVLDGPPPNQAPTRVISGKKGKSDDDDKATRRCMCCDSRVKVPRELPRFRCLCCLTINDLRPAEEQSEADKARPPFKRADADIHKSPLAVERTRAIIDQCLRAYLEARCRRRAGVASAPTPQHPPSPSPSPKEDVFGPDQFAAALGAEGLIREESASQRLQDSPLSTSPPDTPSTGPAKNPLSATIREQADFKQFGGARVDTPPEYNPPAQDVPANAIPERKPIPIPSKPTRKPPPPLVTLNHRRPSHNLLSPPNGVAAPGGQHQSPRHQHSPRLTAEEAEQRRQYDRIKSIFRPLEDYMVANFGDYRCLNSSFSTLLPTVKRRTRSESEIKTPPPEINDEWHPSPVAGLSELDAKTLLLGDIGENGTWWTGKLDRKQLEKATKRKKVGEGARRAVASKSPNISWPDVMTWYDLIHTAGDDWRSLRARIKADEPDLDTANLEGDQNFDDIEDDLADAREHAIRTLLKITENILKRPTRPMKEPDDLRWLLIILANPSLYPSNQSHRARSFANRYLNRASSDRHNGKAAFGSTQPSPTKSPGRVGSQHNGLLKRIFGLLAYASENCQRYFVGWYSRFDEEPFVKTVDLVASFVTYRIDRRAGRPRRMSGVVDNGLIPDLSGSAMSTSAQLHSAMGLSGSVKKGKDDPNAEPDWSGDWQIKAGAKVMAMLFAANNIWQGRRRDPGVSAVVGSSLSPSAKARRSGQLLHTSSFYNTLLDYQDMIADFKLWETRREKFSFCQYPLFLSIGTKIKILEYDARRQMELKAREAYFDQIIRQRQIDGHFHLRVRRDCMVDDSLRQISQAVGAGQEELKKGLRVHFTGEEGVDAGGPRKEWFLVLVREIFDPNHGMFVYDEESNTCYFNPNSFETSDQYYLVGALLGLAIYNSTILDVALPPFTFRKLLAAAPSSVTGSSNSNVSSTTGTKGQMTYTLQDLAEFRPSLAAGLQQLLDFEGDVQATYCRDFVADVERYGTIQTIPLVSNGENRPVTNANRHEFVNAYVRYLLDTAVARQFEPFKRGFFTVCAGNALSLFRAEEIELLVRGSDESLDVDSLRAVAQYENWKHFQPPHNSIKAPADNVPVIGWFWELFAEASPEKQRKLLAFVTGSDRIPAVGATSLILRIQAGGDGWGGGIDESERFPVARTCFNMLILWRYDYKEQLEKKLWRAVDESEGFGLK